MFLKVNGYTKIFLRNCLKLPETKLILRLMQFLVILREFCRLLLGILITLSKIPANLRIS